MRYIFTLALTGILSMLSVASFAQNQQVSFVKTAQQEACGFDHNHQTLMFNDPAYRSRVANNRQLVRNRLNSGNLRSGVDTLWVPVVVHVMHLGEAVGTTTNISVAQIQSAIDNMNDRYNGSIGTTSDTKVQYCLALRDTNGVTTTGIVRVDASGHTSGGDNYGTMGITPNNEQGVKALSKWDHNLYCNVWVVSEIEDNGAGAGTQGYAYFPGASSSVDGVVILYNAMGYDPTTALGYELKSFTNENTTLTHELGHYLDLYHTFEGDADGTVCPTNVDCLTDGDELCDTQAHIRTINDCAGGAHACDVGTLADIAKNYMNYDQESCATDFTSDQKDRMRTAACETRSGLLDGLQCTTTVGDFPAPAAATCSPTYTTPNSFNIGVTNITVNTLDVTSLSSQYDDGRADRTRTQFTELSTSTLYSIDVACGTPNSQDTEVYIDYNNDGDFDDAGENVFSGTANTSFSGSFTTPASPIEDNYLRMRVIADFANNTISGPCYTPQYGEVEEYSVLFKSVASVPSANFAANTTATCTGETVTFTDASSNSTAWTWDFGTGATPATASTQGPHAVTYSSTGNKTVQLDVTGPGGADTETKTDYISISTPVAISATLTTTDETCAGADGTATATVTAGSGSYGYNWSNGATSATASNLSAGTYTCTVTDLTSACTATSGAFTVTLDCPVDPTQVSAADCGTTVGSLSDYINCDPVANAERYQWEFVNAGLVFSEEVSSFSFSPTSTQMALNLVPGIAYGTTYDVRVRAKVGGVWGSYSTVCTVTSPASIPTTELTASHCNTTLTSVSNYFFWNGVPGAERYEIEITDGGTFTYNAFNFSYHPTGTFYSLGLVPGIDYNTTYNIRVRVKVGGVWGSFGSTCTLTTPATQPLPELIGSDCNSTLGSVNEYFYISTIPGAQRYGYEITDGGSYNTEIFTPSYAPTVTWMTLGFASGIEFSTAYNVRVRAKVGGVWTSYGNSCGLTTPADPGKLGGVANPYANRDTELRVWPNPSSGAINIGLIGLADGDSDITIRVYDMLGKQVFNAKRLSTENALIDQLNTTDNFSKGIYLLKVTVDGEEFTEKIVVE